MSSSGVSLLQIPEIPMKYILEYLDFQSILILRKVCHELRNFIDDTKPAFHLTEIIVDVFPKYINFYLYFDRSISTRDLTRIQDNIHYEQNGEQCIVKKFDEENEEIKKTIMDNEDFATVFIQDFDIILRHQKTVLKHFFIYFDSYSTVNETVLISINKSLKSLNHLLQAKLLSMRVSNHNEILSILPYIDPKPLEMISISESTGRDNVVLNLDEIGQLEQWKQAKELSISGFIKPDLSQNLKHFSSVFLCFEEFSMEELLLLKEMFLCSSTLTTMKLTYDDCSSRELIEAFGQPFLDTKQEENWFFRIPHTNQFLKIQYAEDIDHYINFNRIEQSDVPQNARIQN